ncbi:MAG TPA: TIGR04283 family arsenosugar biosynthesis glycosyltransferase [Thermoanaerobaculia bacterium]|nr:TIGR04283 family arsenosugar biosynthesis glycosyltransferase [Thermoanaerobaculia bacterium]
MSTPRLAIVVPTLDEERAMRENLARTLAHADELIISDGGSIDGTREIAARLGARVVTGPAGRGAQLNRGAAATTAELLLFLHADTTLPPGAADAVRAAVARGCCGGGFRLHFEPARPLFRFVATFANLRSRLTRVALGDQAQFATRAAFDQLGGYREWPILEDLDFARRLKRAGRIAILPLAASTSARRFEKRGPLRTVLTNWLIWTLFACGVSPARLARLYRNVR